MNYTKYEIGPFNIHIIETDKFKTITMKTIFKRVNKKEEVTIRNLLAEALATSTKNYPTEQAIAKKTEELYGLSYRVNTIGSGNYNLLEFSTTFLNKKYTSDNILEEAIKFQSEIIFNPNILDDSFSCDSFNKAKNSLKQTIDRLRENPRKYATVRMLECLDPTGPIGIRADGYASDLEGITSEALYKYYLDVITRDVVDVFIIGDVSKNEVRELLKKYYKLKTIKKNLTKSHFVTHDKVTNRVKNKLENMDVNQSTLVMGFKLANLTDFENNYISSIYSIILGGSPDSYLFKNVREKNSLCYNINSMIFHICNLMIISSGIDGENAKKTITLVKKEIENMKKGKFTEDDINNAKALYINSCEELSDSPISLINTYISKYYLKTDLLEDRIKQINEVTRDSILKFSGKVKLDTIFLLEGESGNEED